jgi:hypothetical protein
VVVVGGRVEVVIVEVEVVVGFVVEVLVEVVEEVLVEVLVVLVVVGKVVVVVSFDRHKQKLSDSNFNSEAAPTNLKFKLVESAECFT